MTNSLELVVTRERLVLAMVVSYHVNILSYTMLCVFMQQSQNIVCELSSKSGVNNDVYNYYKESLLEVVIFSALLIWI